MLAEQNQLPGSELLFSQSWAATTHNWHSAVSFWPPLQEWRQGGAGHVMNSVCTNQDQYAGMASWWMLLPIKLQCSLVCTQHTVLVCLEVYLQSCLLLSLFFISTHPSFLTTCLSTTIWYYQNTFCVLFIYIYYLINLLCYIHYFHLTEHNLHLSVIIVLVELCHWWIWGTLLNLHVVFQVKSY